MRIEEKIRDYLAENLEFVSKDLVLIEKEYYLPAQIGARGYIDILAKDHLNNFVIIEIKRSEQAARQTLNELLKYQGLLKQIFKAQESEIRLIIISTAWNELIVPFSEISESAYITGYRIKLNSENIPESINIVEPLELTFLERKLSPVHSCDLFYTSKKRNQFVIIASKRLKKLGIDDFVFVKIKSSGKDNQIVYPYISYLAFQRQSIPRNYEIITNIDDEIEGIEFDDKAHKLRYIDELILIKLDTYKHNDTMEEGDPVKFTSILTGDNWEIECIDKFGIFSSDPRISDELIINEIKGYDGENECKYLDLADSENTKKLKKVRLNLKKTLSYNKKLQKHIDHIFTKADSFKMPYNIVVEIFYPHSLFDAIWRLYSTKDPNYMPVYNIFILFKNSNEIYHYHGETAWNGEDVDNKKVFEKITEEDTFFTFIMSTIGSFDNKLLKLMNIKFVNEFIRINDGKKSKIESIKLKRNEFIEDGKNYFDYDSFFENNLELMKGINDLYKQYANC